MNATLPHNTAQSLARSLPALPAAAAHATSSQRALTGVPGSLAPRSAQLVRVAWKGFSDDSGSGIIKCQLTVRRQAMQEGAFYPAVDELVVSSRTVPCSGSGINEDWVSADLENGRKYEIGVEAIDRSAQISTQVWSGTLLVDTTPPDGSAVSAFDVSDDPEQVHRVWGRTTTRARRARPLRALPFLLPSLALTVGPTSFSLPAAQRPRAPRRH